MSPLSDVIGNRRAARATLGPDGGKIPFSGTGTQGSLSGTLSGLSVTGVEGIDPSLGEPVPVPQVSGGGLGGALQSGRSAGPLPVVPTTPFASAVSSSFEAERDIGQFLVDKFGIIGQPLKIVVDMFAQLDRPQQFLFAAIKNGVESGSALEAVESGFNALVFRRPDGPNAPKDRVDVNEVIDAVGSKFFNVDKLHEEIAPLPRTALQLSLIFGLDPLMWFPGVWVSKAGKGLGELTKNARATYAMQTALSKGAKGEIKSAAAIVNDLRMEVFLKKVGRRPESKDVNVFDMVMEPLESVIKTQEEMDLVHDYITGIGLETLAASDLKQMLRAGAVSPEDAQRVLGKTLLELTPENAESIGKQISRIIVQRRQEPHLVKRVIIKGSKRKNVPARAITIEEGISKVLDRQFMVGQLTNRLGLLPSAALDRPTLREATALIRKFSSFGDDIKKIRGDKFLGKLRRAEGVHIPPKAGKVFLAAMKGAANQGRFIVDEAVAFELAMHYPRVEKTLEATKDLSQTVSGIKPPLVGTEIPAEIIHPEVATALFRKNDPAVRDLHLLSLAFDPKSGLPEPVWAVGKLGEDMAIAHNNVMQDAVQRLLMHKGKSIRGGEGDIKARMVGMALENVTREQSVRHAHKFFHGKSSDDIRKLLRETDPELFAIVQGVRAFTVAARRGMIRRNVKGFERLTDEAPISEYMARMYPNFEEDIANAVATGRLSAAQGKKFLSKKGESVIPPMEMEFIDRGQIWFRSMLPRNEKAAEKAQLTFDTDVTSFLRAYIAGVNRKMWIEPAIGTMNFMGRNLPKTQKQYLRMLLERQMGYPVAEEELLNNFLNMVKTKFGFKPSVKPATKASLAITRGFYRGLLGLNTGFFLKNLTQAINTATEAGPINTLRGVAMFVTNPKMPTGERFRELVHNRNLMRDWTDFAERGFAGGKKKMIHRMDDFIFAPAHFSELFNRGVAMSAGMQQKLRASKFRSLSEMFAKDPGAFADAVQHGHAVANETQFIYGILGRSPIAGSPIGRMGLQFYSWPVKQIQFLKQGWKDEGAMFFLRYVAMSGMVSKIAEHAEVDAGDFIGFGFFPGQAAPSVQLMGNMIAAVETQAVDGDTEASRRHFGKMIDGFQNMVPAFLQMERMFRSAAEIESGVQRGFRGRFSRRVDDPARQQELSQLLDLTVNPIAEALRIPILEKGISGEQFVKAIGLPGIKRNKFREVTQRMELASKKEDRLAREMVDDYIKAYFTGDFVKAQEVVRKAKAKGLPITPQQIKNEIHNRRTPSLERIIESTRKSARLRVLQEARDEDAEFVDEAFGSIAIPSSPLGGTR